MSEGNKVIVVSTSLDREVLVEQLNSLGIDVEVQVSPNRVSEVVQGLLSLPTARERMKEALQVADHYQGDPLGDADTFIGRIRLEFEKFGACRHISSRIRDVVLKILEDYFKSDKEVEYIENLAKVYPIGEPTKGKDLVPDVLMEILKELKGIKDAVKGPELKISMEGVNWRERGEVEQALIEAQNRCTPPVANSKDIKVPTTKEEFVELMTELLTGEENPAWFPPITLVALSRADRLDLVRLLSPEVQAVFAGHYHPIQHGPFDARQIFESVIEALDSTRSNLGFYGLNTLPLEDKVAVRALCGRALGKDPVNYSTADFSETSGHLPSVILGQLAHEFQIEGDQLLIKGLGRLSEYNRGELYGRLKSASVHNEMFVGGGHTEKSFIEKLLEALSNSDVNAITLHDLKRLDPVTRKNLRNAFKASLIQLADLKQARDNFIAHGQRHAPADVGKEGVKDIALILGEFARGWVVAAEKRGVHVDLMRLAEHLLEDALRQGQISANELRSEGIRMDGTIKLGEHAMTLQPNGDMLIVTRAVGGGNVFHYLDIHGECGSLTFGLQPPVGK